MAVLLGLLVFGALGARPQAPEHVLILASPLDSEGTDLGPGLETLLSDVLETMADATVTHLKDLPSGTSLRQLPPDAHLLRFQGRRQGDRLELVLEWNTVTRLLQDRPWTRDVGPARPPREALQDQVYRWPLVLRHNLLTRLVPAEPKTFWPLLETLSIRDDQVAADQLGRTQQLAEEVPGCATAWTVLGDHLYRSLWVHPDLSGIGLNSRTHRAFQQAVDLVPGHPRATFLGSLMLTDTGNQRLAIESLGKALHLRPNLPDLYLGMAYAGRTAGLLPMARKALDHRSRLLGALAAPSSWFVETTYLYQGDLQSFGQELSRAATLRQDAYILFYKGYFALLTGHPQDALGFMRAGGEPGMAPAPFQQLCRVYQALLEGRPEAGVAILRNIDEVRGKLRIPDGEWTFKEAEAYALLGNAERGVDCATRAFVQGFSCAAWYEASPFLAKVREHPRWPMLLRNVHERQAVLEGSFPAGAFRP
ncbi:MAG: hypothetical protein IPI84_01770 [Holophagaceae bacterium]|nr:hypothetical protein [Holophagaceae bacterium]